MPIIAVTDLEGDISRLSFNDIPSLFVQSNKQKMSFCTQRERSPSPGLNRGQSEKPRCAYSSFSVLQSKLQRLSIRSAPIACKQSARAGEMRLYFVIKRSISIPSVAAKRMTASQDCRARQRSPAVSCRRQQESACDAPCYS